MQSKRMLTIALACLLWGAAACDTPKGDFDDLGAEAYCHALAICEGARGTRFGIIGDSWTDIIAGLPLVLTIRDHLEREHGFRLTGSTLAGRRLDRSLEQGLHFQVIDQGGPDMRFMILSLGGNDIKLNAANFTADPNAERARVFTSIKNNLLTFVRTGNAYKIQKYGGEPLTWFIHGYDYTHPDNPYKSTAFNSIEGCREDLKTDGFTDAQIDSQLVPNTDQYNTMLASATHEEASLRHIDLRGTLGGPPLPNISLMADCIHPTSVGFGMITARLVSTIDLVTGAER